MCASARAAGIAHFDECSLTSPTINENAPSPPLDHSRMHRLEAFDRPLYARLIGFGDGPRPDPSEAWRTTLAAADAALWRAGTLRDLAVPPVIRETLHTLRDGLPVPAEQWKALQAAFIDAVSMGSGLRPGRMLDDDPASPHVLAYHDLTRLIEILLLWNLDDDADGPAIKYPEIAYLAEQISLTPVDAREN